MAKFGDQALTTRAVSNEFVADTHAMRAVGVGGTAVGSTTVGSIVLPAGGMWKIFGLWGQVVPATLTAAEYIGGYIEINATSGDVIPNPSPCKYPVPAIGSILGATADAPISPLKIWPITFEAPGKAALDLNFYQEVACTVAPEIAMGIIFGQTVPVPTRSRYCDRVVATITTTVDQAVGTITLAEKATRITRVCGMLAQDGVLVAGEELLGTFRLDSDDIKLQPLELPFSAAIGAGLGVAIDQPPSVVPVSIDVNIPVQGGARVDVFVDLNTAVTNGCIVSVYLEYE